MAATEAPVFAEDQHIIERPRLTRMLDESTAKVILLLAPAGYGKTTLARQWLRDKPHIWYRASAADADVAALAIGLATTASRILPGADARIRQRMLAVQSPEDEAGVFADIVAEDLARIPSSAWIAIDDYHNIAASPAGDTFVRRALELLECRFVLTSRVRPNWAAAREVIYGTIQVVSRDALAMTDDEVAAAVGSSASDAPVLFREAMGWPAVVGLAAHVGPTLLEGRANDLPADLYDFFAEELWQVLSPERRWDVAQLGLVAPFPLEVAEELFGDSLHLLLDDVSGGWITRDGEHIAVHPLFLRFLRSRFQSFPGDNRTRATHRLLGSLTTQGNWDQAMTLAFGMGAEAVSLVATQGLDDMLSAGRLSTVQRWIEEAEGRRLEAPILSLAGAELAYRRGEYALAESLAASAATQFEAPILRAHSWNRAGQSARRLERLSTARAMHQKARAQGHTGLPFQEAVIGELLTALDSGEEDLADLLRELDTHDGSPTEVIRSVGAKLQVALRRGGVVDAIDSTTPLVPLLQAISDPLVRTSFLYIRAGGFNACGRYHDALQTLAQLKHETDAYRIDFARDVISLQYAFAEDGLRNFRRSRAIASEVLKRSTEVGDAFSAAGACINEVRVAISSSSGVVPPFRSNVTRTETAGVHAEYLSWLALAEACFGSRKEARRLLQLATKGFMDAETRVIASWAQAATNAADKNVFGAALDLTHRIGYLDVFVHAYRGRPELLTLAAADRVWRDTVSTILSRANDFALAREYGLPASEAEARSYRLTKREIEVYRLLVEGLSNRLIARRLFITEPTAKLHVRHILQKLGSRTRAEAVAKWRDVLGES